MPDLKSELVTQLFPGGKEPDVSSGLRDASKIVVLTSAAYTALATKDPTTIYFISG